MLITILKTLISKDSRVLGRRGHTPGGHRHTQRYSVVFASGTLPAPTPICVQGPASSVFKAEAAEWGGGGPCCSPQVCGSHRLESRLRTGTKALVPGDGVSLGQVASGPASPCDWGGGGPLSPGQSKGPVAAVLRLAGQVPGKAGLWQRGRSGCALGPMPLLPPPSPRLAQLLLDGRSSLLRHGLKVRRRALPAALPSSPLPVARRQGQGWPPALLDDWPDFARTRNRGLTCRGTPRPPEFHPTQNLLGKLVIWVPPPR